MPVASSRNSEALNSALALLDRPEEEFLNSLVLDAARVPVQVLRFAALRGLGYTFVQIGAVAGVSPQAVQATVARYRRSLDSLQGSTELAGLSTRAINVLSRQGVSTREEARKAGLPGNLAGERNCGRKTIQEIQRWMDEQATHETNAAVA